MAVVSKARRLLYWLGALVRRPIVLRRSYTEVWAIGCTSQEIAEIDSVDRQLLGAIEVLARRLTASRLPMSRVKVLCYGSRIPVEQLQVPFALPDGQAAGLWSHEQRTAAVRVSAEVPLRRALAHELCHAMIETLTGGFAYPPAIAEGYAEFMAALLSGSEGVLPRRVPRRVPSPGGTRPTAFACTRCYSIAELLDHDERAGPWVADAEAFLAHSAYLIEYLGRFGKGPDTVRERMLRDLHTLDIRDGHAVYNWLTGACRCGAAELEQGYTAFHRHQVAC
jgi:hypothetical protein